MFCFVAGQRQSESWGEGSRWDEMRERQRAGQGAGKHPQLSSAGTHCSYPWSSLQLSTCPQISSPCPGLQPCLNRPTFSCPLPVLEHFLHPRAPPLWPHSVGERHSVLSLPSRGEAGTSSIPLLEEREMPKTPWSFLAEMFLLMLLAFTER